MTDQKQEAGTLTLGERIILAARLAVMEHLRQSVTEVPFNQSYFGLTEFSEEASEYPSEPDSYVFILHPANTSLTGAA